MPEFEGKRALVVGFGKSGAAAVRFLAAEGARITVCDTKTLEQLETTRALCAGLEVEYRLGPFDPDLFRSVDLVVLSPGVPRSLPAVSAALESGVRVTNEPSLAFQRLQAPVIAVTGSAGKTTTCTLIAAMLRASEKNVYLGGNIGTPLLDLVREKTTVDAIVAELSSFQLETVEPFVPAVTLFTPIGHDHLDRYPSAESYHAAKERLLNFGKTSTTAVFKVGNPIHERFSKSAPGRVLWYSTEPLPAGRQGAWFDESTQQVTFVPDRSVVETKGKLGGMLNRENVASAACAARAQGASVEAIQKAVDEFGVMAHRMELVREKAGVRFFNDSKSTNVISATSALSSFPKKEIIWIAGGRNKAIDFAPLRDLASRKCKLVVLIGEARSALRTALEGAVSIVEAKDFPEAVRVAAASAAPGDSVVLSPACASQDMFKDYEDRGETFRRLVQAL